MQKSHTRVSHSSLKGVLIEVLSCNNRDNFPSSFAPQAMPHAASDLLVLPPSFAGRIVRQTQIPNRVSHSCGQGPSPSEPPLSSAEAGMAGRRRRGHSPTVHGSAQVVYDKVCPKSS